MCAIENSDMIKFIYVHESRETDKSIFLI